MSYIAINEKIKNVASEIAAFDGCNPNVAGQLAALDLQLTELIGEMNNVGFKTDEFGDWIEV